MDGCAGGKKTRPLIARHQVEVQATSSGPYLNLVVPRPLKSGGKMANPVVHFEIGTRDKSKSADFFRQLFGWKIDEGPAGMVDAAQGGIAGHLTSLGHEPHHYVTVYVEVDALEVYLQRAIDLGGKVLVPPVALPHGSFAWFADPDDNILGLWRPNVPASS